jgi:hypothetical protein
MRLGIANKYPEELQAAKDTMAQLQEAGRVEVAIESAIKKKDRDGLAVALAKAKELNHLSDVVSKGYGFMRVSGSHPRVCVYVRARLTGLAGAGRGGGH